MSKKKFYRLNIQKYVQRCKIKVSVFFYAKIDNNAFLFQDRFES